MLRGHAHKKLSRSPDLQGIRLRTHAQWGAVAHFLSYSPEFKEFVRTHKGVLSAAAKLLFAHEVTLEPGATIHDAAQGIEITRNTAGALHNYKVTTPHGIFYASRGMANPNYLASRIATFQKVDTLLAGHQYAIGGVRVHVLKPHLIYFNTASKQRVSIAFLVSDFYPPQDVVSLTDIPDGALKSRLHRVFVAVSAELCGHGFSPLKESDLFYQQGEETLIIRQVFRQSDQYL